MCEITLELVEHYLCAIGWSLSKLHESRVWVHPDHQETVRCIDARGHGVYIAVLDLSRRLEIRMREVGFRLGVCASAERIFARMRKAERHGAGHEALGGLSDAGNALLRSIGIDPVVWESARNPSDAHGAKAKE